MLHAQPTPFLERVSAEELADGIRRTPVGDHVIWSGVAYPGRQASIRAQVTTLLTEVWTPVSMRALILRAARLSGDFGLAPDRVRSAIRMHQAADGAAYFLVHRESTGDYTSVTDIPRPVLGPRLLRDDLVLSRSGVRFAG